MSNGNTFAAGEGDWRDRGSSGFKIYKLLVDGPWPSRETLIGDAREESRFCGAARALRHAARTHHVDIDCKSQYISFAFETLVAKRSVFPRRRLRLESLGCAK